MPIERWSDQVNVVRLLDDPQFTDDLQSLEDQLQRFGGSSVLDFASVKYINSSNISRLLRLRKRAITMELKLILCGISTQLWGTFLTTGLDKIFEFSDNVTTALATLQISADRTAR
jgi:anti-anti-sigma factor